MWNCVWLRIAAAFAVIVAGILGIYPPGFVAQVVAFAFGLAAASFFPILLLGIFDKRTTKEGAIAGMFILGLVSRRCISSGFALLIRRQRLISGYSG